MPSLLAEPTTVSAGYLRWCWEHNDWTGVERLECWNIPLVADGMPLVESVGRGACDEANRLLMGLIGRMPTYANAPTNATLVGIDGGIVWTGTHYPQYPSRDPATDGPIFHGAVLTIPGRGIPPDRFTRAGKTLFVVQVRHGFAVHPGDTYHRAGDYPDIDEFISWLDAHPFIWADHWGQKARSTGRYRLFVHPYVQRALLPL